MMSHQVLARTALVAVPLALCVCSGCKDEAAAPEEARDAGSVATGLESLALGVRVPLLESWRVVDVRPEETGDAGDAKTIAAARRLPSDRPFVAAPRLVMTVEDTVMQEAEPVFRDTLAELKSIGMREGVHIVRTALSSRPVRGESIGDLEMVYSIITGPPDAKKTKTIHHRSIVVLRSRADESRAIVTVTATYLAEDRDMVGAEVQVMLDGVELFDPPREP